SEQLPTITNQGKNKPPRQAPITFVEDESSLEAEISPELSNIASIRLTPWHKVKDTPYFSWSLLEQFKRNYVAGHPLREDLWYDLLARPEIKQHQYMISLAKTYNDSEDAIQQELASLMLKLKALLFSNQSSEEAFTPFTYFPTSIALHRLTKLYHSLSPQEIIQRYLFFSKKSPARLRNNIFSINFNQETPPLTPEHIHSFNHYLFHSEQLNPTLADHMKRIYFSEILYLDTTDKQKIYRHMATMANKSTASSTNIQTIDNYRKAKSTIHMIFHELMIFDRVVRGKAATFKARILNQTASLSELTEVYQETNPYLILFTLIKLRHILLMDLNKRELTMKMSLARLKKFYSSIKDDPYKLRVYYSLILNMDQVSARDLTKEFLVNFQKVRELKEQVISLLHDFMYQDQPSSRPPYIPKPTAKPLTLLELTKGYDQLNFGRRIYRLSQSHQWNWQQKNFLIHSIDQAKLLDLENMVMASEQLEVSDELTFHIYLTKFLALDHYSPQSIAAQHNVAPEIVAKVALSMFLTMRKILNKKTDSHPDILGLTSMKNAYYQMNYDQIISTLRINNPHLRRVIDKDSKNARRNEFLLRDFLAGEILKSPLEWQVFLRYFLFLDDQVKAHEVISVFGIKNQDFVNLIYHIEQQISGYF
ncbi:MAG: hypothetical protein OXC40_01420, partial [Proteobacteria bacterium]|nr:hypothetical protein [Pseudomonadota bacterium]